MLFFHYVNYSDQYGLNIFRPLKKVSKKSKKLLNIHHYFSKNLEYFSQAKRLAAKTIQYTYRGIAQLVEQRSPNVNDWPSAPIITSFSMVWNFRFKPFFVTRFWNFLRQHFSVKRTKFRKDFARSSIVQQRFWSDEEGSPKTIPESISLTVFYCLENRLQNLFSIAHNQSAVKSTRFAVIFRTRFSNCTHPFYCKCCTFYRCFSPPSAPFSAQFSNPKSTSSAFPAPTA